MFHAELDIYATPTNETDRDRRCELAIAGFIEREFNCTMVKLDSAASLDFKAWKNGAHYRMVEIKVRRNRTLDRHASVLLNLYKFNKALAWHEAGIPTILVYLFSDGTLWWHAVKADKKAYDRVTTGRKDRADNDVREAIVIPTKRWKKFSRFTDGKEILDGL